MERRSTYLRAAGRLLPLGLGLAAPAVFTSSPLSAQSCGAYTPAQAKDGAAIFAAEAPLSSLRYDP